MSASPSDRPRARAGVGPRTRWLDALTGGLLLASAIVAAGAAAPAVLRAAGARLPEAAGPGAAPTIDLRHRPPEILGDPDKILDPDHDIDPEDGPVSPARAHGQLGHARCAALLRDRPGDGGKPLGEIKAGELVMILKESGDWVQVWANGAEGVLLGWVKKSGIAVR